MPGDNNIRVSVRPRPLRALFTKYAPQAANTALPVRPLGVVRRPGSSQSNGDRAVLPSEEELSELERVYLYLEGGGMDGNKIPYLTSAKYLAKVLNSARDEKNLPKLSKSQTFENHYKLAASRETLYGPGPPSRSKAKRLITLPMYQVKVNSKSIELDDSEAVESTRKSLRNLMEVGKIKASHPDNGVVAANIKNFPFNDLSQKFENANCQFPRARPIRLGDTSTSSVAANDRLNPLSKTGNTSEPDQFLGDSKAKLLDNKSSLNQTEMKSRAESDLDRMNIRLESVAYTETVMSPASRGRHSKNTQSRSEKSVSFSNDKSSPLTKVTTSTTREYLNRSTPFVPGVVYDNDCCRSLSVSVESRSPNQMWPSLRDIHNMKVEACRQATRARKQRRHKGSSTTSSSSGSECLVGKTNPTLRYTNHPRNRVLDPIIIVPSHTNDDCPMCNLHLCCPDTSSCPPNSPTIDNSSCAPNSPIPIFSTDDMESQDGVHSKDANVIVIPTADVSDDETSPRLSAAETVCGECLDVMENYN